MLRSVLEVQPVAFKFRPPFDVLAAKKNPDHFESNGMYIERQYLLDSRYGSNSSIR